MTLTGFMSHDKHMIKNKDGKGYLFVFFFVTQPHYALLDYSAALRDKMYIIFIGIVPKMEGLVKIRDQFTSFQSSSYLLRSSHTLLGFAACSRSGRVIAIDFCARHVQQHQQHKREKKKKNPHASRFSLPTST